MNIHQLQTETSQKFFEGKEHYTVVANAMLEKAYHAGRKQGHKEMSQLAKRSLSSLIPDDIYE